MLRGMRKEAYRSAATLRMSTHRLHSRLSVSSRQHQAHRLQKTVTRVASVEQTSSGVELGLAELPSHSSTPSAFTSNSLETISGSELDLEELDGVQEQLLSWMMLDDEDQENSLDEMIDWDEFGDEEYSEELKEEVEALIEAADVELKIGDRVTGLIYEVDEDGAYVEIGQKYSGFVPLSECSFARLKTPLEVLRVGMSREFMVVEDDDDYGQIILSLAATEASVFWLRMRQLQEESQTVIVKVESANRGGLVVKHGPYEGFVPVSQFGPGINPESMEALIGKDLPCKFMEVDEEKERLVFSNKRVAGSSSDLGGFKIGDMVEGVVQSLRPYGAFLDLGNGAVGLLHVSQISHERILSLDKILRPGDRLKVLVLSLDAARGRVTLSTKKLEPNPGDMLRDPQLVFDRAEEMAETFRKRVDVAESNAASYSEGQPGSQFGVVRGQGAADFTF